MAAVVSAAFTGQAGVSSIVFGGRRYFRLDLSDFPSSAFTFTCLLRLAGGGPLMMYGSPDEGSDINGQTTFLSIQINGASIEISSQSGQVTVPGTALADGHWHRLAARFVQVPDPRGRASIDLFIDGFLVSGASSIILPMANDQGPARTLNRVNTLALGIRPHDPGTDNHAVPNSFFEGQLRDVRIWSSALSDAAVVQSDFASPVNGTEAGLYLALPLDDAHLDVASGRSLDLTSAHRNALWVAVPSVAASFGLINNFVGFPLNDRTVQMWVRCGIDAGPTTLFSYGPVRSSDASNDEGQPWRVEARQAVQDGSWHHLSVVVDSKAQTEVLYVDGILKTSTRSVGSGPLANQMLLLGAHWATDADEQIFTGQMRDVRLWSTARTAEQIATDARGTTPTDDSNLVARWPLDPAAPGQDVSGNDHNLSFNAVHVSEGQQFVDPGAGYFTTDTVISGRPCHLIISNLDELVIAPVGATGQPPGTKTVPIDKDLLVFANRLTIYGKIHVPGGRIEIYTKRLAVVGGSQPELSTEPEPRPRTLPEVAGGGFLPGTRPTLKSEMNRLPISAQAFLERGGSVKTLALPIALPEDWYAAQAGIWGNPDGFPQLGIPPASVEQSGLPGAGASASPSASGVDAVISELPSIRIVARRVHLTEKLKLTARGGAGAPGQSGQTGANGSDAKAFFSPIALVTRGGPNPSFGGFGGNGGDASPGGSGGAGGLIEWVVFDDPSASQWFDFDAGGGPPGEDGIPGAGGRGGLGSLFTRESTFILQVPRSPDGAPGTLKGARSTKGKDGTVQALPPNPLLMFRLKFFLQLLSSAEERGTTGYQDCLIDSDPDPV
ncbi:MAG TPA: LamG-like jellyroll fold domain-containing protein [Pyrinomonadaceae bacterium]